MKLDPKALRSAVRAVSGVNITDAFGYDAKTSHVLSAAITAYLTAIGETHVLVPRDLLLEVLDRAEANNYATEGEYSTGDAAFYQSERDDINKLRLAAVKEGE